MSYLTFICLSPNKCGRHIKAIYRCKCGVLKECRRSGVIAGITKSCGCLQKEVTRSINLKHGHNTKRDGQSPTYVSWSCMKTRCLNRNCQRWKDYGGRGIKICKRWSKFENFLKDMGKRPPNRSLDRINNDGDYKPSNCRWATQRMQVLNQRGLN
jgi:hypothetical protein